MIVKKYTDWEKVLLDTSAIVCLLRSLIDDKVPTCNFIKKLLEDLSTKKSSGKKNRTFYISAISIAEILSKTTSETKAEKIVKAIQSDNVIFYSFDTEIAEFIVKNYHAHLGREKLNDFARQLSWPEHDLSIARQWIEKDLMLIATAHFLGCDTIITIDKNTMLPLAEKVDYYCCIAEEANFQLSTNGNSIFNYNKPSIPKPKKASKRKTTSSSTVPPLPS